MSAPGLLARARSVLLGLPLFHVECVLRRVPVVPVQDDLPGVRGVARVRGCPTPVLDMAGFLGLGPGGAPERVIVVRVPPGQVALEVDEVLGVYDLDEGVLSDAPPLLESAAANRAAALFARDRELGLVLDTARLISAERYRSLVEGAP